MSEVAIEGPTCVDDDEVRADRRRRLFEAMAAHELDALILGRPAEVAFASGARQLWTAGSRPFGPAAVAVLDTGRVHLLSVSDFDVPPEVGHDDLYGLAWNPANLVASLAAIPGLRDARRVGTTSSSPGFPRLVASIAPNAEIVDASPAVSAVRTPKTPAEVSRIRAAMALAAQGLDAMAEALRPGVTERALLAAHAERIASLGAPLLPTEGVACATATSGAVRLRRVATDRPIEAGQLVALDAGAFFRGYEGGVGRTLVAGRDAPAGGRELAERCVAALHATVEACRAGATGADVVAAWSSSGEPLPPVPLAHGTGLGVEPPVIGDGIGAGSVLVAGTVLAVTGWVVEEGVGGHLERDLVLVTDGSPEVLTAHIRRGAPDD
jgi:Xaa-Pro dipeptidase